jgi:hypothetical protein
MPTLLKDGNQRKIVIGPLLQEGRLVIFDDPTCERIAVVVRNSCALRPHSERPAGPDR